MSYNDKYRSGGWSYDRERETARLRDYILDPLKIKAGQELLEIGCGMGLHSAILADYFGLSVIGVDLSDVGIESADAQRSLASFFIDSASNVGEYIDKGTQDVILSRGMSWYHYNLSGPNLCGCNTEEETRKLFEYLKPGGVFVLLIRTDFTGSIAEDGVYNNKLQDYLDLFEPLGEVVLLTDCGGVEIDSQETAERSGNGIIIATRKRG